MNKYLEDKQLYVCRIIKTHSDKSHSFKGEWLILLGQGDHKWSVWIVGRLGFLYLAIPFHPSIHQNLIDIIISVDVFIVNYFCQRAILYLHTTSDVNNYVIDY